MMLLLNSRGECGKMNLIWETCFVKLRRTLAIRCRVVRVDTSNLSSRQSKLLSGKIHLNRPRLRKYLARFVRQKGRSRIGCRVVRVDTNIVESTK